MDEEGISMDEFRDAFQKGNLFASGIGMHISRFRDICKVNFANH